MVVGAELEPGLSLDKLDKGDRMEEMEFHFPMAPGFLPELAGALPKVRSYATIFLGWIWMIARRLKKPDISMA